MTVAAADIYVVRSRANFFRSRFTGIIFALLCLYVQVAILLPASWLAEVVRCMQITLSAVVVLGYWKAGTACFYVRGRWPQKQSVVALGILISWSMLCASASWGLFWRLAGQPGWMVNNDFFTFWTYGSSFAASLHIVAPNMVGEAIPVVDRRRYSAAVLIGGFLILLVGFWRPDLSALADTLRSVVDEPDWAREGLLRWMQLSHAVADYVRGLV